MTFKGLSKPKSLKGLKGIGKKKRQDPMPTLSENSERFASVGDDEVARLTRELGDAGLAKRVLKLKKEYPDATVPELVCMDWLKRRQIRHGFQVWVLGGRVLRGGQVLDFVIDNGPKVIVLEVQGAYWHTRPGKPRLDAMQRAALRTITIWGKDVGAVVEVWDTRLLDKHKRNGTMTAALAGQEMGR